MGGTVCCESLRWMLGGAPRWTRTRTIVVACTSRRVVAAVAAHLDGVDGGVREHGTLQTAAAHTHTSTIRYSSTRTPMPCTHARTDNQEKKTLEQVTRARTNCLKKYRVT